MMITRGSTPTVKLQILDWDPGDSMVRVFAEQDNRCLEFQPYYDPETRTTSFNMSGAETVEFEAGAPLVIWQEWTTPDGTVYSFPKHEIDVGEYLCNVNDDDVELVTGPSYEPTTDTTVQEGVVYFEQRYVEPEDMYGLSPLEEKWFEFDDQEEEFFLSQDMEIVEDKEYYMEIMEPVEPSDGDNPAEEEWYVMVEEPEQPGAQESGTGEEIEPYELVLPVGTENPVEEEWYVKNLATGYYELATDTTVVQETLYYKPAYDQPMDNHDEFMEAFGVDEYMQEHGFVEDVAVSDVPSEVFMPMETETGDDRNPYQLGWYQNGTNGKEPTADTTVTAGKAYFIRYVGEVEA